MNGCASTIYSLKRYCFDYMIKTGLFVFFNLISHALFYLFFVSSANRCLLLWKFKKFQVLINLKV